MPFFSAALLSLIALIAAILPVGFVIIGVALVMLLPVQNVAFILTSVALFASGVALISPSLATTGIQACRYPHRRSHGATKRCSKLRPAYWPGIGRSFDYLEHPLALFIDSFVTNRFRSLPLPINFSQVILI